MWHGLSSPMDGSKEVDVPPLEGKIVEPKGTRVWELIEKLLELDPNLFVATVDCCSGEDFDIRVEKVEVTKYTYPAETWLKEGDSYVVID